MSDLHLGFRQFQRQTAAGINQREADVAAAFRVAVDRTIAIAPDIVVLAGDIFHNVRPSNPAILHAFTQFSRLAHSLPGAVIVMVAGNHDTPRAIETGCILRLFAPLGIHVIDAEARRVTVPERQLAILGVPDVASAGLTLEPDPGYRHNVLVMHAEVAGTIPVSGSDSERSAVQITADSIGASRWGYVALGHYHVFRQIAPNACYSGAIEYTSSNIWSELQEERQHRLPGKGIFEFDLATGKRTFHPLRAARSVVDLPVIQARQLAAAEVDAAVRANVEQCPGGIEDRIVRQVVRDIPRHIVRELDHRTLREYRRRALHFGLDTIRPDAERTSTLAASGRRPSLSDIVLDKLRSRLLQHDVDRDALVDLGMRYLREAEELQEASLTVAPEHE